MYNMMYICMCNANQTVHCLYGIIPCVITYVSSPFWLYSLRPIQYDDTTMVNCKRTGNKFENLQNTSIDSMTKTNKQTNKHQHWVCKHSLLWRIRCYLEACFMTKRWHLHFPCLHAFFPSEWCWTIGFC